MTIYRTVLINDSSSCTDFVIATSTHTMAVLTSFRNILCLTLFAIAIPTAFSSSRCYPTPLYRFRGLYEYKNVTTTVDCSFKKCDIVCKSDCVFVPKKVPYKVHKIVKVPHGKVCRHVKVYCKHIWVWNRVCKTNFIFRRTYKTLFRIAKKNQCTKKCRKVCKTVPATCVKIKVYRFPIRIPTIICGYRPLPPGDYPDKKLGKGELDRVIDGKRTIHD